MDDPTAGLAYLLPRDVAKLLGCSAEHVKRMAARGLLPGAVDLGLAGHHEWRFDAAALRAGLRRQQLRDVKHTPAADERKELAA